MILICIFLMAHDVEHLFMWTACILIDCLFLYIFPLKFFFHIVMRMFYYPTSWIWDLQILSPSLQLVFLFSKLFLSQSKSFNFDVVQFIIFLMEYAFCIMSKNSLLNSRL